jgi:hypothetical protein
MPTGLALIAVLLLVACLVVDIVLMVVAKISKEAGGIFAVVIVVLALAIAGLLR